MLLHITTLYYYYYVEIFITTQTGRLGEKAREARFRRFGHVQRRDNGDIGGRMLEMELPGRRPRGRTKRRRSEGGHAGREQAEMKNRDSLWQPLKRDKP